MCASAFGDEERHQEDGGGGEAGEHLCLGEAGPAGLDERVDQQGECSGEDDEAWPIGPAGVLVPYPTIVQLETPPELMGRVSATAGSLPTVLQLVAPIAGAALAQWQGVGFVLTLGGCLLAALGLAVAALRPPIGLGISPPELVPASAALGPAKLCKTSDELACIRAAQRINELAMTDVQAGLRLGLRQNDLSARFLRAGVDLGAHGNGIDPIWQVMPTTRAQGPWTTHGDLAFPTHYRPSDN